MAVQAVRTDLLIDLPSSHPYHRATRQALHDSGQQLGIAAEVRVVSTEDVGSGFLAEPGGPRRGIVIGPGTPYERPDAAHDAIRIARERGVPLVAT